jgi:hypothetical protein
LENLSPIAAILERDIDLLFLEELYSSPLFLKWLVRRVFDDQVTMETFISAHHSIFDRDGESDIVLRFRDHLGTSWGVLIENKIAAAPQPDQAMRYRTRAETGAREGHWEKWKTLILAPADYLVLNADGYDSRLSYEDIAGWYETNAGTDLRAAYRARILRDAIARARRTGISRLDPAITEFWKMYYADASLLFSELEMKAPGDKGPNSNWIQFRPKRLGSDRTLDHKLPRGCVDLSFSKLRAERLDDMRQKWSATLSSQGATAEQTGESLAVRALVPHWTPGKSIPLSNLARGRG